MVERLLRTLLVTEFVLVLGFGAVRLFFASHPAGARPPSIDGQAAQGKTQAWVRPDVPAPQAGQPAPSVPGAADAIQEFLQQWAGAWSRREADTYLGYYGPDFQPGDKLSLRQWQAQRRDRLAKQKSIQVALRDIRILALGPDRATVRFVQDYRSDSHAEKNVVKEMELQKAPGGWHIVSERQVPIP